MTGLYVTHDQAEAVVLGDRIGVMRDGKLLQWRRRPELSLSRPFPPPPLSPPPPPAPGRGGGAPGARGPPPSCRRPPPTPGPPARSAQGRWPCAPRTCAWANRAPTNAFSGRVIERRYQGMQTVYDVDLERPAPRGPRTGHGRAPHGGSAFALTLPPDLYWAYRDEGAASVTWRRVLCHVSAEDLHGASSGVPAGMARGLRVRSRTIINSKRQADNGSRRFGSLGCVRD